MPTSVKQATSRKAASRKGGRASRANQFGATRADRNQTSFFFFNTYWTNGGVQNWIFCMWLGFGEKKILTTIKKETFNFAHLYVYKVFTIKKIEQYF